MIDPDALNVWNEQRMVGYLWRNPGGFVKDLERAGEIKHLHLVEYKYGHIARIDAGMTHAWLLLFTHCLIWPWVKLLPHRARQDLRAVCERLRRTNGVRPDICCGEPR